MAAETLTLPFRFVLVPIVIKPGFTNRNHFGMRRKRNQLILGGLFDVGVFRVHANAGKQTAVGLGNRQNLGKIFQIDAYADGKLDLIFLHALQDIGQIVG